MADLACTTFSVPTSSVPTEYWDKNMKIRNISSWMGTILLAVLAVSQVQAQSIDIKPTDSTSQIFKVRTQLEGRGVVIPAVSYTHLTLPTILLV